MQTIHKTPHPPVRYWFKNKTVGIGWQPATWEGWAVTGTYIGGMIMAVIQNPQLEHYPYPKLTIIAMVVLTMLFILLIVSKGEPLNWDFWKK